jgi:DNA-directed RNA polymerase subunit M/transcription elongation factor TFIIS
MKAKSREGKLLRALGVLFKDVDPSQHGGLSPQSFIDLKTNAGPLFTTTVASGAEINELAGLVALQGLVETFKYLTDIVIPKLNEMHEVGQIPQHSIITFESPTLEVERRAEKAMLSLNEDKGPLTDAASCPKCGAPKVHRKVAQTRSADEGMTSIFLCPRCLFGWSEG